MTYFLLSRQAVFAGAISALFLFSPVLTTPSYAQDAGFCSSLLSEHPAGGAGLEAEVQTLLAAAPGVAGDIVACAGDANEEQAKALGAGLAKVVTSLKTSDAALADDIAELVLASESKLLKTAYRDKVGGATAAINDGGGDGGGSQADGPALANSTPVVSNVDPSAVALTVRSSGGGTGGGSVSPN